MSPRSRSRRPSKPARRPVRQAATEGSPPPPAYEACAAGMSPGLPLPPPRALDVLPTPPEQAQVANQQQDQHHRQQEEASEELQARESEHGLRSFRGNDSNRGLGGPQGLSSESFREPRQGPKRVADSTRRCERVKRRCGGAGERKENHTKMALVSGCLPIFLYASMSPCWKLATRSR